MKTILSFSAAVVVLAIGASPCFALWEIAQVTPKEAKELGIKVRSAAAGPNGVRVEMEFNAEGQLKAFDRVDLRVGEGEKVITASLKEDRSKPGRIVVSFSADRSQLAQARFWVFVPGTLGGSIYEVRAKDFVELEKGR